MKLGQTKLVCEHSSCQRSANLYLWRQDLKIPVCFKHAASLEKWGFKVDLQRELLPEDVNPTKTTDGSQSQ